MVTMLLLGGCVSVTRTLPDGSTERLRGDALREYAAEVFRRHNAASSALLQALPAVEAADPDQAERLLDAEDRMNAACAPIDALAIAYRDGRDVDLGDKLAFSRALEDCERATAELTSALAALDRRARVPPAPGGAVRGGVVSRVVVRGVAVPGVMVSRVAAQGAAVPGAAAAQS